MTWRADTAYRRGLDFFGAVVDRVEASRWLSATPCEGWRAVDILGHVGAAVAFGTALLSGEPAEWRPADPPGDAVGGDPVGWWSAIVEPARLAAREIDLEREVDAPGGPRRVETGLAFPAVDLFVHGWDLARAAGSDAVVPAEAIEFAHATLGQVSGEQLRSSRVFGPAVEAPHDASPTEAFVAWTGRDPRWQPSLG